MSNHFHIFIYVPEPEELGDEKARRGYAFMYGNGGWEIVRACHEQSMREAMSEILAAREAEKAEAHDGVGGAKPRLAVINGVGVVLPQLDYLQKR